MCQRAVGVKAPRSICPLCQENIWSKVAANPEARERSVRKHVADHLEQLAYFVALPVGQTLVKEDDSEFQDDSDSEDGLQSEIQSVVSKVTHLSKKEVQVANVRKFFNDQQRALNIPGRTTMQGALARSNQKAETTSQGQDQSVRASSSRASEPVFPVLIIRHPPNEHFYSRQDALGAADKVLRSSGSICVFHGVGGVGKTLAAVQYIFTRKQHYDAIIWLQADTAPGLADSYLQMVIALKELNGTEDHHHIIDKGRNWLQETG